MASTYASPEDVAKNLRGSATYSTSEGIQWQAWLSRVERAIELAFARAGYDLAAQVEANTPRAQDVADVEVAAVVRKAQNPNQALTSVTRSVDDAQITERNESGSTGDALELTDAELRKLMPTVNTGPKVFSILPS